MGKVYLYDDWALPTEAFERIRRKPKKANNKKIDRKHRQRQRTINRKQARQLKKQIIKW